MDELCRKSGKETISTIEEALEQKELPCKKCILLAICKGLEEIHCDILWEIVRQATVAHGNGEDDALLDLIEIMFPNSMEVFQYTKDDKPHVSFRWKGKRGKYLTLS